MKLTKLASLVTLLLICAIAFAAPKNYGKKLTVKEKTKVSDILADPEKFAGKKVLVEGAVVDVCKERGCWIKVASDKEFESIRFKVDDGVIVFPLDAKGKTALVEGVVSVKTYSKEDLVKQGEAHAKEEGTKSVVQIKGEGAVIK